MLSSHRAEFRHRKLVKSAMTDHMPPSPGVYKLVNWATGQCYVGGSKDVRNRCRGHVGLLMADEHHSFDLQESFNRFGMVAFAFVFLESCPVPLVSRCELKWFTALSPDFCVNRPDVRIRKNTGRCTTIPIRLGDLNRLQQAAGARRQTNIRMLGTILDAWETLTPEQQSQVIRRESEPASAK